MTMHNPLSGTLRFVDEAPQVSIRTGMLVVAITSGDDEQRFVITGHAAQMLLENMRRVIIDLTEQQRNVVSFSPQSRTPCKRKSAGEAPAPSSRKGR